MIAITLVLLFLPTALEAWLDIRDHRQGKRDKKKTDIWLLRLPSMFLVSAFNAYLFPNEFKTLVHIGQGMVLSFGLFFLLFDTIMGYLLVKDIRFLGTTSGTDRLLVKIPWHILILFRLILFGTCWGVYNNLDIIL